MLEQRYTEIHSHISIYLTMLTTVVYNPPYNIREQTMNMSMYKHENRLCSIWFLYDLVHSYARKYSYSAPIGKYKYIGIGQIKSNIGFDVIRIYVLNK